METLLEVFHYRSVLPMVSQWNIFSIKRCWYTQEIEIVLLWVGIKRWEIWTIDVFPCTSYHELSCARERFMMNPRDLRRYEAANIERDLSPKDGAHDPQMFSPKRLFRQEMRNRGEEGTAFWHDFNSTPSTGLEKSSPRERPSPAHEIGMWSSL